TFDEWAQMGLDDIPQANLDHALRHFSDSGLRIPTLVDMSGSWPEFVQSWLAAAELFPNVTLRYEDCIEHPEKLIGLETLFRFSADDIRGAIESVNGLVRKESESNQRKKVLYNKMRSYYFANYFSASAVEKFCDDNAETL